MREEQSLLFDQFKAFDKIESSYVSDIFHPKRPSLLRACAIYSELQPNVITMVLCVVKTI